MHLEKGFEKRLITLSERLKNIIVDSIDSIEKDENVSNALIEYNVNNKFINDVSKSLHICLEGVNHLGQYMDRDRIVETKKFIDHKYGNLFDLFKMLMQQLLYYNSSNVFWKNNKIMDLIGGSFLLLQLNFRSMKAIVNQHLIKGYKETEGLSVDEDSPLWESSSMTYMEYPSDFSKIRVYARKVVKDLPDSMTDTKTILEQQTSEIIKNAIKHGNGKNPDKKIKIWYEYTPDYFKVIVEDEGEGFKELEKWNKFYINRSEAFQSKDYEKMMQYVSYRSSVSDHDDGGNSLFSAVEFWDSGLVYNNKKNKVVAVKYFYE